MSFSLLRGFVPFCLEEPNQLHCMSPRTVDLSGSGFSPPCPTDIRIPVVVGRTRTARGALSQFPRDAQERS